MYGHSLRPEDTRVSAEIDMINYVGYRRSDNQDNCCINAYFIPLDERNSNVECSTRCTEKRHLYGVFDGVGSDASGEIASLTAAHFFAAQSQSDIRSWMEEHAALCAACVQANEHVLAFGSGSATTAVLLGIADGCAYTAHLGDSRAYLLRGGELTNLVADDITPAEDNSPERSHCITRYLGAPSVQGACLPGPAVVTPLEPGDMFLLCSDGLSDMLSDAQLRSILTAETTSQHQRAVALVQEALANGGYDNITALLVRITALER